MILRIKNRGDSASLMRPFRIFAHDTQRKSVDHASAIAAAKAAEPQTQKSGTEPQTQRSGDGAANPKIGDGAANPKIGGRSPLLQKVISHFFICRCTRRKSDASHPRMTARATRVISPMTVGGLRPQVREVQSCFNREINPLSRCPIITAPRLHHSNSSKLQKLLDVQLFGPLTTAARI